MSRYIDAKNLDFFSHKGIPDGYKDTFTDGVLYALNVLDAQQTVDAVPVVRCSECKHSKSIKLKGHVKCGLLHDTKPYDWFCKDGERREVTE